MEIYEKQWINTERANNMHFEIVMEVSTLFKKGKKID
jgi:hypothetical protein